MPGIDYEHQWTSLAALGREATPADIAAILVFLASFDSGWLRGETIFATGSDC